LVKPAVPSAKAEAFQHLLLLLLTPFDFIQKMFKAELE
jgi:hypothetical protein